ncbi:MAG: cysteine desulfurase [Bacteroidetes bacterium]|nr:cysteine desulfurase [Bacteroidota bacterium]
MPLPIYFDYNATTPVDPAVVEAMAPFWGQHFGNPSSNHAYGWAADEAVEQARERVAALIGAETETVVFTSGASESVALGMLGAAKVYGAKKNHVITVATEHKAVLETAWAMEREGFELTILPVDENGVADLDALREAISERTLMISMMLANNETGVLGPVAEAAEIAHEHGAFLFTDATQAFGKIPVDVDALGADLLALSAHKFYGPKGVGALFVRRKNPRVKLASIIPGAGQQDGLRGGTLNAPGIVGLGKAAEIASERLLAETEQLAALRDRFENNVLERIPSTNVNGANAPRLPNTSSLRFDDLTTAKLLPELRGLAVSTGSACQTKTAQPSHVLTAMHLTKEQSFGTIRFSIGHPTTEAEVDAAIEEVVRAVGVVRGEPVAA